MTHAPGKLVKVFLLTVLSAVLLAGFASVAEAEQAVAVGCTSGTSLRMRAKPSTSSEIITVLSKKYTAMAILDGPSNGWYKVAYCGKTGYLSADYVIVDKDNRFTAYGQANGDGINIRSKASTEGAVVGSVNRGAVVTISGFEKGWYEVTLASGTKGFIRSDFLNMVPSNTAASSSGTTVSVKAGNSSIADTAQQYLGVRYVWGGASPSGFDCSGYTMYIAKQFGHSLPHTASGQWLSGRGTKIYNISELQPGDLVFFNDPSRNAGKACSHVGIYIGNGQHIHASSSKQGVVTSDLTSGYYNRYFIGGIRL